MKFLLLSVLFLSIVFPAVAENDPRSLVDSVLRVVNSVDHKNHRIVIDDNTYYMPLNFKVYIQSNVTGKSRLANRYALKADQSVYVGVHSPSKKPYVNVLIINQ